jgi:hypothetical protein
VDTPSREEKEAPGLVSGFAAMVLRFPELKERALTFLTGVLLYFALGLLFDHSESEDERKATTVYGQF